MADVVEFIKHKPVHYTVHVSHDEHGFSVRVMDVSDNQQSRERVAEALRKAADLITDSKIEEGE